MIEHPIINQLLDTLSPQFGASSAVMVDREVILFNDDGLVVATATLGIDTSGHTIVEVFDYKNKLKAGNI